MIDPNNLQTRDVRPGDEGFLYRVFCSTRPDVMISSLPPEQKESFLKMQYNAQATHYQTHFPGSQYMIICLGDSTQIGRLYLFRSDEEFRILDIAFLPEYRSKGFGTQLLVRLMDEVDLVRRPLRIHVELGSRQVSFYERLGFVKIAEIPTHQEMEYKPGTPRSSGIVV